MLEKALIRISIVPASPDEVTLNRVKIYNNGTHNVKGKLEQVLLIKIIREKEEQ